MNIINILKIMFRQSEMEKLLRNGKSGGFVEMDYSDIINFQNQHLIKVSDVLLPRLMSGMIDVEELEVGSLKYEVNDSLGMVAEENSEY